MQPDGRTECLSCGVIFARWQPTRHSTQERRITRAVPIEKSSKLPWPWIAIGLAFLMTLGLIGINRVSSKAGISHNRPERVAMPHREAQALPVSAVPPIRDRASYPPGLSEADLRAMLERCSFFQESKTFDIPRSFEQEAYEVVAFRYPALLIAEKRGLIVVDRPRKRTEPITVTVTPIAYSTVNVDEEREMIHFSAGQRRIDTVWVVQSPSDSEANIGFTWTYERPEGLELDGSPAHAGAVIVQRDGKAWGVARGAAVDIDTRGGLRSVCP